MSLSDRERAGAFEEVFPVAVAVALLLLGPREQLRNPLIF
jgi:hypothetical protein